MTKVFNKTTLKERRQFLRKNMPKAEVILWSRIRRKQTGGCRFRRQYSVGSYVLDFYCPELKLAIEVDGDSHYRPGADEYDKDREESIRQLGIEFLRFQNTEVYQNLNGVLQTIYEKIELMKSGSSNRPPVVPLVKGDRATVFPLIRSTTRLVEGKHKRGL